MFIATLHSSLFHVITIVIALKKDKRFDTKKVVEVVVEDLRLI